MCALVPEKNLSSDLMLFRWNLFSIPQQIGDVRLAECLGSSIEGCLGRVRSLFEVRVLADSTS